MFIFSLQNLLRLSFFACAILVSGCAASPKVPLDIISYPVRPSVKAENLLILLRGIGASNSIFEEEGIIDEIRRRRLPIDIVAPDTHVGYYDSHTLEERLRTDIIIPARKNGYRQIWLAGFSMGGLGSLFYLRLHPKDVDGVFLISPFLGWDSILHEIKDAGGVASWQRVSADPDDWQRFIWSWLKEYAQTPQKYPPVYLGYGRNDWLADEGPPLLATVLPGERVFTVPGNHTVGTFKVIFSRHLDTLETLFPPDPKSQIKDVISGQSTLSPLQLINGSNNSIAGHE